MSGRWLLDVALLYGASKRVVSKHFAIRSQQLEKYNKTSTLTKAVAVQADKLRSNVRATSEKYNGAKPQHSPSSSDRGRYATNGSTSLRQTSGDIKTVISTEKSREHDQSRESSLKDHGKTATSTDIHQETARKESIPDRIVPSVDLSNTSEAFPQLVEESAVGQALGTSVEDSNKPKVNLDATNNDICTPPVPPVVSSLPPVKIPELTEDARGSNERVPDSELNQDVFSSSKPSQPDLLPESQAVPAQESVSEEINPDIFHSPRVAKMLGGTPMGNLKSRDLNVKGLEAPVINGQKAADEKDSETFSTRDGLPEARQTLLQAETDTNPDSSSIQPGKRVENLMSEIVQDPATLVRFTCTPFQKYTDELTEFF
jgi:aarF domain-containing kinase